MAWGLGQGVLALDTPHGRSGGDRSREGGAGGCRERLVLSHENQDDPQVRVTGQMSQEHPQPGEGTANPCWEAAREPLCLPLRGQGWGHQSRHWGAQSLGCWGSLEGACDSLHLERVPGWLS